MKRFKTDFIDKKLSNIFQFFSYFDKTGCEILFNLLSNRNDKGSIIITSNLAFDRWEEIFNDPLLTGAIVDRLAYKSHVLNLSREASYRFEETVSWLKNNK